MKDRDLDKVIRVRVTVRDHDDWVKAAMDQGTTLSEWVRQACDEKYYGGIERGPGPMGCLAWLKGLFGFRG